MIRQQIVNITAQVKDGRVMLVSSNDVLVRSSDGSSWLFEIGRDTAPYVVFHLEGVDDLVGVRNARSATRTAEGTWEQWQGWKQEDYFSSPTFEHGDDFKLEIELDDTFGDTPRGGFFILVRYEGAGN